jgi:hypothetical protein
MSRPPVAGITDRIYSTLPAAYRDADAAQDVAVGPEPPPLRWLWAPQLTWNGLPMGLPTHPAFGAVRGEIGYPLLRYIASLADQVDNLAQLVDRFAYVPEDEDLSAGARRTADLIDPATADAAWLPYIAMFRGGKLDLSLPVAQQRASLETPAALGWYAGSADSIVQAAQRALTDTQHVALVYGYGGDPFTIAVQTLVTETPDDQAVLDAIDQAGVRPAGFDIVIEHYQSSWDSQEAAYPTWATREAAGSWDTIESVP